MAVLTSTIAFFVTAAAAWILPPSPPSETVRLWWALLSAAGAAQFTWWLASYSAVLPFRLRQWQLAGVYTFVCWFRSVFPRADVQRICLWDTWLSSVAVGRSLATVAELCFALQWALLLHEYSGAAGRRSGQRLACTVVILITIAECCSWYATLTTNFLGNAFEESLWGVSVTLLLAGLLPLIPRASAGLARQLSAGAALCAGYVAYMALVDVPMYVRRWLADEAAHRAYLPVLAGIHDVAERWIATTDPGPWHAEMPWMSLYFTVAVWASLSLTRAPRFSSEP